MSQRVGGPATPRGTRGPVRGSVFLQQERLSETARPAPHWAAWVWASGPASSRPLWSLQVGWGLNAGERLKKQLGLGLKKGLGRPLRHLCHHYLSRSACCSVALLLLQRVGRLVLQHLPGRARAEWPPSRSGHREAALSPGTQHSSHHLSGPYGRAPQPNALAFPSSSGAAGPPRGACGTGIIHLS